MQQWSKIVSVAAAVFLSATSTMAQEIVDSGTARQGMHACPVGYYMTGIHVGNNYLLCDKIGDGYQESQEVVDSTSVDFDMHACPYGQVMSGFHESRNLLLCVPLPSTQTVPGRFVDRSPHQTVRQNMHACPPGLPMAGIHVDNNYLLCQYGTQ